MLVYNIKLIAFCFQVLVSQMFVAYSGLCLHQHLYIAKVSSIFMSSQSGGWEEILFLVRILSALASESAFSFPGIFF